MCFKIDSSLNSVVQGVVGGGLQAVESQTPVAYYGFRGEELLIPCRHGMPEEYIWAVYWHKLHFVNGSVSDEEWICKRELS